MSHSKKPFVAVVSSTMPTEAVENLRHIATAVIVLPPDPSLPAPVSSHPDMLLFSLDGTLITYRSYYAIAKIQLDRLIAYTGLHLCLTEHPHGDTYPHDIGLNALRCGSYVFGKLDHLAPELIASAKEHSLTPVSVAQGYAACSGLIVGDVLMTADPSLTRAAVAHGISVLPTPSDDILLPGYDHGFFGGVGGVWRNIVLLCGTPTPEQIEQYFSHPLLHGTAIHFLYSGPLFDCGGIQLYPL